MNEMWALDRMRLRPAGARWFTFPSDLPPGERGGLQERSLLFGCVAANACGPCTNHHFNVFKTSCMKTAQPRFGGWRRVAGGPLKRLLLEWG